MKKGRKLSKQKASVKRPWFTEKDVRGFFPDIRSWQYEEVVVSPELLAEAGKEHLRLLHHTFY